MERNSMYNAFGGCSRKPQSCCQVIQSSNKVKLSDKGSFDVRYVLICMVPGRGQKILVGVCFFLQVLVQKRVIWYKISVNYFSVWEGSDAQTADAETGLR